MNFIFGIVAKPMGWLLYFLYELIGNYGITLIVFTVIVRVCLFPLYASQIKHSSALQDVQPKMQEIQRKYANNKELLNEKMMELYQKENVNPAKGCLPMLIQMPIIMGLFALLRNPMVYISNSDMIMAVHEGFMWIGDLSQSDPWILPILAGLTTFISFKQTSAQNSAQMAANPTMKMMQYFFPLMIVWMGRSFPAGLTLYWFIGTLVQIGQNRILNSMKKKNAAKKEAQKTAAKASK